MIRKLTFIPVFTLLLTSFTVHCMDYGLFLNYQFNGSTKNPWGDLTVGVDYGLSHNSSTLGQGRAGIGLRYDNTPGLMGEWGHLQVTLNTQHSNPIIDATTKLCTTQVNPFFDYNPIIIHKLDKIIDQLDQKIARLEALKQSNDHDEYKEKLAHDKKLFLEQKKKFEIAQYSENDPDGAIIRDIINQIEKKNGY